MVEEGSNGRLPSGGSDDQKVEKLFVGKGIPEIKQIEQKTRLAIERKREELRQLVGERYHDMIEAADSVIQMKEDANNVKETLTSVQMQCREIQQMHLLKGTGGQQVPPTISHTQSVAAQIKLILDLQAKIWYNLEKGDLLSSTLCFLLMRNGSSRMRTLETAVLPSIITQFTQRTSTFKASIIQSCRKHLRSPGLTADEDESIVDTLVSLLLLEGCGLDQVLVWFLEDRKEAIQDCFSQQQAQSTSKAVKEVVRILQHSILHIHTAFSCGSRGSDCLIVDRLHKAMDSEKGHYHKYIPEELVARLPESISLGPTTANQELTIFNMDSTCISTYVSKWLESCLRVTETGLKGVFVHVSTLRGLANIRSMIEDLLTTQPNKTEDDSSSSLLSAKGVWSHACQLVLNEDLSLYDKFIRHLLLARAKNIIEEQLKESDDFMQSLLYQLVSRHHTHPDDFTSDCYMSSFLWSTRDEQELAGVAEGESGMLRSLRMKSRGCTPQINHFCESSSSKLQSLVEDLNHFLLPNGSNRSTKGPFVPYQDQLNFQQDRLCTDSGGEQVYPFNKMDDIPPLLRTLEELLTASIDRFLVVIDQISAEITTELKQTLADQLHTPPLLDRLILTARLCSCVVASNPSLKELVSLQDGSPWQQNYSSWKASTSISQTRGTNNTKSHKVVSLMQQKADELLGVVRSTLEESEGANRNATALWFTLCSLYMMSYLKQKLTLNAVKIWCRHLACCFLTRFRDQLYAESECSHMSSATIWEEINISEEAESGQKVSSSIRLPAQASVFIVTTLYALCQEITRVGGHSVNQVVLKDLVNIIFSGLTELYLEVFKSKDGRDPGNISQQSSLQALFDYRFISSILWSPSSDKVSSSHSHSQLLDVIISHIDPFDYDVFSPHLTNLIERQLQRSTVMFGILFSLKENLSFSPQTFASSSSSEKHNILPLSLSLPRIPFLPGSTAKPLSSKSMDPSISTPFYSSTHSPSFFTVATTLQHI